MSKQSLKQMKMSFAKMHGLGNDFVMINYSDLKSYTLYYFEHYAAQGTLDKRSNNFDQINHIITRILDRRIGIGADQLIIYEMIDHDNVKMTIYNQDGSEAKACGNASRCLVRLFSDNYGMDKFTLHAGNRKLNCLKLSNDLYSVNMGEVTFNADWMPNKESIVELARQYNLEPKDVICADIGNPHLVLFSRLSSEDKSIIGKNLQDSKLFPNGVNVNFAEIEDNYLRLKVFERGAGFTLACGSGACATFASSVKLGYSTNQSIVKFDLGKLNMFFENGEVIMQGPAEYSFVGEFYCD